MAADPNDARTKRRKAMGDDPNKTMMAPQPIPGLPQNQKGGNVANYPMMDVEGQMGQQMGSGGAQYPYGDGGLDKIGQASLGNVGFTGVSGKPQNQVPGRAQNMFMDYNTQPQPDAKQQSIMEPMYEMAQADGMTMPGDGPSKLFGTGNSAPYFVTGMGPTGAPMDSGSITPGAIPPQVSSASREGTLPLQGMQSAEAGSAGGMSTGRGGGRNKGKN